MSVLALVPARMASSRFPGKPLADILGLPMIEHVRRRVLMCSAIDRVVVATCDREIYDVVSACGGEAVMTADTHERCTDRIAEASFHYDADIIINVQGDEPFVNPEMFPPLLAPLLNEPELLCSNLMAKIDDNEEFNSSNVVKVVVDCRQNAVYFSREPIPSVRKASGLQYDRFKQLGVIAFRTNFLKKFTSLPQTPLETVESVDMLRAVEYGFPVRMVLTDHKVIGVDTPEDLARSLPLMRLDPLFPQYFKE